jgi:hypothetical protein
MPSDCRIHRSSVGTRHHSQPTLARRRLGCPNGASTRETMLSRKVAVNSQKHGSPIGITTQWAQMPVCLCLVGIIEARVTHKDRFALVVSPRQTFGMNQAQTGHAEILVRAGVSLTFNGFAAPAVGIIECVLSTKVPQSKRAAHRGILPHAISCGCDARQAGEQ